MECKVIQWGANVVNWAAQNLTIVECKDFNNLEEGVLAGPQNLTIVECKVLIHKAVKQQGGRRI